MQDKLVTKLRLQPALVAAAAVPLVHGPLELGWAAHVWPPRHNITPLPVRQLILELSGGGHG